MLRGPRMFKPGLEIFLVIHSLPSILSQEHRFHLFFNMIQFERKVMARVKTDLPLHLSPNVLTSGRIFGSVLVEHTTMGTLSGL